jgi:hypothetical protein
MIEILHSLHLAPSGHRHTSALSVPNFNRWFTYYIFRRHITSLYIGEVIFVLREHKGGYSDSLDADIEHYFKSETRTNAFSAPRVSQEAVVDIAELVGPPAAEPPPATLDGALESPSPVLQEKRNRCEYKAWRNAKDTNPAGVLPVNCVGVGKGVSPPEFPVKTIEHLRTRFSKKELLPPMSVGEEFWSVL